MEKHSSYDEQADALLSAGDEQKIKQVADGWSLGVAGLGLGGAPEDAGKMQELNAACKKLEDWLRRNGV